MPIDPRAFSDEKLVPPAPLPYISRKALKRVKDAAPIPDACQHCGDEVKLVNHAEIYGREYGDWPYAYRCTGCGAYIGVHPNTDIPLGTLANYEMREARKRGKKVFMALRGRFNNNRGAMYQWLAREMGIPESECHWGMFSVERCRQAQRICNKALMKGGQRECQ